MADKSKRVSENTPGEFFVDLSCINCGTCRKLSPTVFGDSGRNSFVGSQPATDQEEFTVMQALIACPVHAIGALSKKVPREVPKSFPIQITEGVYLNGYNSESSYGADSYFIKDPGGNWMVDSPRLTPILENAFKSLGGIKYIFLTHRDDVADADRYAKAFDAQRIIHERDLTACPDAEIVLRDEEETLIDKARIIPTPGHTAGHCVLLWNQKLLFTGDHLPWSPEEKALRPFNESCWYSWEEQVRSVQKLSKYDGVEWVLPGHGYRYQITQKGFPAMIDEAVAWMSHIS